MKRAALFTALIFISVVSLNLSLTAISLSQEKEKKLALLQEKHDALLLRYTERHPDVIKLRTMINKLKISITHDQKTLEKTESNETKKTVSAEKAEPVPTEKTEKATTAIAKNKEKPEITKPEITKDEKTKKEIKKKIEPFVIKKAAIPLNPVIKNQKPGTWIKLPNKGPVIPKNIHAHCGIVIDPATSILYFFGSDTHNIFWNNDVWSYNPVAMTWKQHYEQDDPADYQYKDGYRSTTTGRPWCMHTFAMNVWDPVHRRLIVPARPVHYNLEHLPQVKYPPSQKGIPEDAWWEYDPARNRWEAVKNGPYLRIGEAAYIPTIRKIIGFNSECHPVAFYDPNKKTFELFKDWRGLSPKGYTRKAVYDTNRDRILLISSDKKLWSFDYNTLKWSEIKVADWPEGGIYGSWDYDASADILVSVWSKEAKGGFGNSSGQSTVALCDLKKKKWIDFHSDPIPPYFGMNFKVVYDVNHEVTFYCTKNEIWSFKAPTDIAGKTLEEISPEAVDWKSG